MKYFFIFFILVFKLYAIEYPIDIKQEYKLELIKRAQNFVSHLYKEKIDFENIYYNQGLTGIELICGELKESSNKKNKFIYINDEFTFIEENTKDFILIWDQLCKYDNRVQEYYRVDKSLLRFLQE